MITYCGDSVNIKNAILVINQDGFKNSLYEEILNAEQFTYTDLDNKEIAKQVLNTLENKTICVKVYYPKWRWSSAIGYFSKSKPNNININGYKLKYLSTDDLVSNFCHEIVHCSSASYAISFDHDGNNPKGKENSAPYAIGTISRRLVEDARNN